MSQPDESRPSGVFRAVTKSDTVNLPLGPCRALKINVGGDVSVVGVDDNAETFTCSSGEILPVKAKRVNSAGTTASGIIAMY